jgi:succinate dehydrogenase hydrophobic anchor subunit
MNPIYVSLMIFVVVILNKKFFIKKALRLFPEPFIFLFMGLFLVLSINHNLTRVSKVI